MKSTGVLQFHSAYWRAATVQDYHLFFSYINKLYPNLQFTIELEKDNRISFLDILITKDQDKMNTNIFRKTTFTGLGLSYYSFCSKQYKTNSRLTLISRAYKICSNCHNFHLEIQTLQKYFKSNYYPPFIFTSKLSTSLICCFILNPSNFLNM